MDLVTDFKKYYTDGAKKIIEYLKTVYVNVGDENNAFYLEIDKYYRALFIWKKALFQYSGNSEREKLLDNILHNYCSMVHNVAIGDVKVLYFLYRNIIESFIRYITNNLRTRDLDGLFSNVNRNYVDNEEILKYVQTYVSQLKQIYDESCLYIHADTTKIERDVCTLLDVEKRKNVEKINILKNQFIMINIAMLCLLKVRNTTIFYNMKENAQGYLDYVIPLKERIKESNL